MGVVHEAGTVVGSRSSVILFLISLDSAHTHPSVPRCSGKESTGKRTFIGNSFVEMVTRNIFLHAREEEECRDQWTRGRNTGMVVSWG